MPLIKAGTRSTRTLDERLRHLLDLSLGTRWLSTAKLVSLVRVGAVVTFLALAGFIVGLYVLMNHMSRQVSALGTPPTPQVAHSISLLTTLFTVEFLIIAAFLSVIIVRTALIAVHINRFYQGEYLGTWSLLHHRVLGPELAVEDFWRPLYKKPTTFSALKFPAYSKTLEDHLLFLAAFLEALRDAARGPSQINYLHWLAGHGRIQRFRMRKTLWIGLALYPLLLLFPLGRLHLPVLGLVLGYLGFLLLAACALLVGDGTLELQHRARLRTLCEFLLDEGGPDPADLPPPPEIIGSPQRQWWVRAVEVVARRFNWRGGREE